MGAISLSAWDRVTAILLFMTTSQCATGSGKKDQIRDNAPVVLPHPRPLRGERSILEGKRGT